MALYWHKGTIIQFKALSHHVNHGYAEDQDILIPYSRQPPPTVQSLPGMQEHTAPDVLFWYSHWLTGLGTSTTANFEHFINYTKFSC